MHSSVPALREGMRASGACPFLRMLAHNACVPPHIHTQASPAGMRSSACMHGGKDGPVSRETNALILGHRGVKNRVVRVEIEFMDRGLHSDTSGPYRRRACPMRRSLAILHPALTAEIYDRTGSECRTTIIVGK